MAPRSKGGDRTGSSPERPLTRGDRSSASHGRSTRVTQAVGRASEDLDVHPAARRHLALPAGMSAKAPAPSIEVSTWESWRFVGTTCQPSSSARRKQRSTWSRSATRPTATSSTARARVSAGSAPSSRRSAGRTNRWKVTIADTGLPGSPKTSAPGAVPNHVGLPGLRRTPQKTSSTPRAASAGFTWSCGPTDTPPEMHTTSAPSRASRSAARLRSRSSGIVPAQHHLGSGALGLRREAHRVRVADLARPERLAHLHELVARAEHRDPRAARAQHLAHAQRGEHAQLGRPEGDPRPQDHLARRDVLPGAPHVGARDGLRHAHVAVGRLRRLDGHHGVRAGGDHRARGDDHRLPGPQRALGRAARARLAHHRQGGGRPGHHGVAVHGGRVEGGKRVRRPRVLVEHPPERLDQGHGLAEQRLSRREHALPRGAYLQQGGGGHGHVRARSARRRSWRAKRMALAVAPARMMNAST